jgi:hypothetical protein
MDEDGEFIDNDAPPRRRAPSPNSRPTLNFPHLNKPAPAPEPEPDETIRLSPAQAQDLLHHARTPTEELARQLPAPDDGLGNYGQQLLDLGSGFDSFDLSDLAPPDAHHQPPDLDLSIELPWLSHDDAEALQPRAPEPATFDRREHTLPIEAPDLEHVSSGAVEVDLTHSEPEPPLQAPPVSGQLGTESGGFGIVRRHPQGSDPGRAIRTPHPPARTPTGPTTRRASTTTVDPEITRKIDRAQVLRRGGLHEEAQRLLEEVMESDPNNSQARHLFQLNTEAMNQKFLTRLGNLEARPELAVHPRELKGKGLDSRAGYLLTLIDGMSTWQDILELSPMSDEETAELLVYLLREGVIRSR